MTNDGVPHGRPPSGDQYVLTQGSAAAQVTRVGATAHQAGTVRFGTDPQSSALDVTCRAHDVDNLYVLSLIHI